MIKGIAIAKSAIAKRCLINKRTWILINTKIAIVMTYLTKNAIVKRYLINKRTWILNNTKTNIVKKSRTPKRSYTINTIKIVIDKRYQFQMLTWIPNTAMKIIDIIVMTYLHIEPAECHWPTIILILKTMRIMCRATIKGIVTETAIDTMMMMMMRMIARTVSILPSSSFLSSMAPTTRKTILHGNPRSPNYFESTRCRKTNELTSHPSSLQAMRSYGGNNSKHPLKTQ